MNEDVRSRQDGRPLKPRFKRRNGTGEVESSRYLLLVEEREIWDGRYDRY